MRGISAPHFISLLYWSRLSCMEKCIAKERGEDHVGWGCVDVEWSVELDDGNNGDQRIMKDLCCANFLLTYFQIYL